MSTHATPSKDYTGELVALERFQMPRDALPKTEITSVEDYDDAESTAWIISGSFAMTRSGFVFSRGRRGHMHASKDSVPNSYLNKMIDQP